MSDYSYPDDVVRKWKSELDQANDKISKLKAELENAKQDAELNIKIAIDIQKREMGLHMDYKKMREVLRDIRDNFDHDQDAHRYETTCRKCAANQALEGKKS